MERRSSDRDGPSPPPGNPNVFDDDFEIDPDEDDFMPSVSDGFRPTTNHNHNTQPSRHDRPRQDLNNAPPRPLSTAKPTNHDLRRTATRNSTAKVRDSMSQDRRLPLNNGSSARPALSYRDSVSSTSSFATTGNSENPFGDGPSHPYGMYTQNTTVRPISMATTTSERPLRRSMSLQQPTHPYGMYSQSGLSDEGPLEEAGQPSIPRIQAAPPVGFLGQSTGYHRMLGPDGEEQDIIGPDGHAEQLPPYSRHPVEGPTKASLAAEASLSRVIPAPAPVDLDDPFMTPVSPVSLLSPASFSTPSLSTAPLLPSVTPARLPRQRPETQSGSIAPTTSAEVNTVPAEPSESSSASLLTTENSFSEKEEPASPKIHWRKRKLWGRITIGAGLIALTAIITLAVAVGAVIGSLVSKKPHGNGGEDKGRRPLQIQQPQMTPGDGVLYGAMPISTPSGFVPLPTGQFSLPLGLPQESRPGCLTQPSQFAAWSCRMTFAPLIISVNNTNNDIARQFVSIKADPTSSDVSVVYGLQPPQLEAPTSLQLVLDLDYRSYGPAWHFSLRYDKVVVLKEEDLNVSQGQARVKRQDFTPVHQKFQVKPGDNPWFCFWNHTFAEVYIYAQDNSSAAYSAAISLPTTGAPTDVTGATNTQPPPLPPGQTSPTPTPAAVRRDASSDASASSRASSYPRIVKVEERRILGSSTQPYCQKMQVSDGGKIAPAQGSPGSVSILLQERDPSYGEFIAAATQPVQTDPPTPNRRRGLALSNQKRADPSDSCHCQWMFQ